MHAFYDLLVKFYFAEKYRKNTTAKIMQKMPFSGERDFSSREQAFLAPKSSFTL